MAKHSVHPKQLIVGFALALVFFTIYISTPFDRIMVISGPDARVPDAYQSGGDTGLTEYQARDIAQAACIKGEEALSPGQYNSATKTWWFDANLNSTRPGCSPACVVSEQTRLAEINWRCTGAIVPESMQ